jgi:hypothetical protein
VRKVDRNSCRREWSGWSLGPEVKNSLMVPPTHHLGSDDGSNQGSKLPKANPTSVLQQDGATRCRSSILTTTARAEGSSTPMSGD